MTAMPLLVGLAALAASLVTVVLAAGAGRRPGHAGVEQIETWYARDTAAAADELAARTPSTLLRLCRDIALKCTPSSSTLKRQHKLDLAGNPANWSADKVLASKTVGAVVLAVLAWLIGSGSATTAVLFTAVGAAAGFFLPDVLVHNLGLKRQETIRKALADSMDMLTVCVEAGLGFDAAVARVARTTSGPLAAELARMLQEMQFGMSRVEALKAMGERTTVPELKTLISALVQASKLGVPIAAVMREQASEMRTKRRQRAEEQAQKVTVKILFPLIFCLLPALFVVVMGPGVINIVHSMSGM